MAEESLKKLLKLNILSPDAGEGPIECDAVMLTAADGSKGNEGGLYCIHPGHAHAVILLDRGRVTARLGENTVMNAECGDGFARVMPDCVTVTVSSFSRTDK
ncbi:MAG: hypothetical protein IKV47_02310 [Oscillospiraceae bacterium]|nr:hypothetical protein [Oscillospiraceae bacterium]